MLTIFNVLLNRVVCHWISLTVEDEQVTHEELGMVAGRCMGVFNADDGMLGSRYPEWLQGAINVLIRLFRRVLLMENIAKYKTTTCQTGEIFTGMSEEEFGWRSTGEGVKHRECLRLRIPCTYCGVELTEESMTDHHRLLYGVEPKIDCY